MTCQGVLTCSDVIVLMPVLNLLAGRGEGCAPVTARSCTGRVRLEACRILAGEAWEEGSRCLKYQGTVPLFSVINSVLSFEHDVSWDELWVTEKAPECPQCCLCLQKGCSNPSLGEDD